MKNNKQKLNKIFYNNFTSNELEEILKIAYGVSEDRIYIIFEDYTFNLYIKDGKLNIYCDDNDNISNSKIISKDEFIKLYKPSLLVEIVEFEINE